MRFTAYKNQYLICIRLESEFTFLVNHVEQYSTLFHADPDPPQKISSSIFYFATREFQPQSFDVAFAVVCISQKFVIIRRPLLTNFSVCENSINFTFDLQYDGATVQCIQCADNSLDILTRIEFSLFPEPTEPVEQIQSFQMLLKKQVQIPVHNPQPRLKQSQIVCHTHVHKHTWRHTHSTLYSLLTGNNMLFYDIPVLTEIADQL